MAVGRRRSRRVGIECLFEILKLLPHLYEFFLQSVNRLLTASYVLTNCVYLLLVSRPVSEEEDTHDPTPKQVSEGCLHRGPR